MCLRYGLTLARNNPACLFKYPDKFNQESRNLFNSVKVLIPFLNNEVALLLIVAHSCSWLLMVASLVFVVKSMRYSFSETVLSLVAAIRVILAFAALVILALG